MHMSTRNAARRAFARRAAAISSGSDLDSQQPPPASPPEGDNHQQGKVGRPSLCRPGIWCFVIVICFPAFLHTSTLCARNTHICASQDTTNTRQQFVLKHKPLAARRSEMLAFLAIHTNVQMSCALYPDCPLTSHWQGAAS
eukprot:Gregarina_sp_Poly_1__7108@NODE_3891_length_834_cov_57_156454_g540_i3_p1_GENE_NODE_3891_length_834_cov_57_156454_g540_i3NODE_3891_length_834_cov_57_156454_g540_i3_p1_ORF_typecomplete_len141_score5_10_NODE_3891_length_834_cov_57_156454_g540_i3239661